jgi:hypothetical protein
MPNSLLGIDYQPTVLSPEETLAYKEWVKANHARNS